MQKKVYRNFLIYWRKGLLGLCLCSIFSASDATSPFKERADQLQEQVVACSVNVDQLPLKAIFELIEKQTGYNFLVLDQQLVLERKITIHAPKSNLQEVLKKISADTGIRFVQQEKRIIVQAIVTKGNIDDKRIVKGQITDNHQQPLPGVSVRGKYTGKGTVTDANGFYQLEAANDEILVISYMGFLQQQVKITDESTYNIILQANSQNLPEVIVTALGIRKDLKTVGYAVQEVKGQELLKAREPNAINGLVGKVAGMSVGISSEILGAPTVLMRGSELYLYVVDGMPINSDTWNINPDDVESYTVLKGPSAAALYGNRALNGAILITTKKGAGGKKGIVMEFNSSTQFNKGFLAFPKLQDEYGPGSNGKYAFKDGMGGGENDGDYDVWGPRFEGQPIAQYDSPIDPVTGNRIPTPWVARGKNNLKRFIQTGILSANNIAMSYANDRFNLRTSLSNTYQRGLVPNTKLNTTNVNIYAAYNITPRLKIESNINYSRQATPNIPDVTYGPQSVIYDVGIWTGADWDISQMKNYWQPGKEGVQAIFEEYKRYHNPWFMSYEWLRGHYKTDVYGYLSLSYRITDDLSATVRSQISGYDLLRTEKMPWSAHPYGREDGQGDYREDKRSLFDNNTEAFLKYNKQLRYGIGFNIVGGANARSFRYNSSFVSTNYLNTPGIYSFDNSRDPLISTGFNSNMLVLSAYYAVDVAIMKYLSLSVTGRVDRSSALLPGHNTFFYPSVSMSTVLSDYLHLPAAITMLKLNVSYANVKDAGSNVANTIGTTPNMSYPIDYGAQYYSAYGGPVYALSTLYNISKDYNNLSAGRYSSTVIDPGVNPYNRSNYETGLDIRFLKNRLGLNATYFKYIDGPRIYSQQISETTGYTSYTTNAVKTAKDGIELSLTGTPVAHANGFNWNVMVNWSTYKEVYKELPAGLTTIGRFFRVGDRVDKLYTSALLRTEDGQVIYNAGGKPIKNNVPQYVGNMDPDCIWGINNRFSYRNLSISFQFDGRVGGMMQDFLKSKALSGGRALETIQGKMGEARYQDYVHRDDNNYQGTMVGDGVVVSNNVPINIDPITGKISNYKDLQFAANRTPTLLTEYVNAYYGPGASNIMSKSFAKLREVVISYELPEKLLHNTFISHLTASLVGRNLLYFADDRFKDVDIDQYPGRNSSSNLQTPTTRSYGINLNLAF